MTPPRVSRAPRVRLAPICRLRLKLKGEPEEQIHPILNISSTGFAVSAGIVRLPPEGDSILEGTLVSSSETCPIRFRVARVAKEVHGFQFEPPIDKVATWVARMLHAELSAIEMKAIPKEKLATKKPTTTEGTPEEVYWFSGGNQCELYFTMRGSVVEKFTLCFFGNYLRGGEHTKFQFSEQIEGDSARPIHIAPSKGYPLQAVKAPSKDFINQALQFLLNIQGLSEFHRDSLSAIIRRDLS